MDTGKSWKLLAAAIAIALGAATAYAAETITYTYDARGRLVKVERSGTVNNGVKTEYVYDKADNRTNVTVTGAASSCTNATPSWGTGIYGCFRWGP